MNNIYTRNNKRYIGIVAVLMLFSVAANIYYYTSGTNISTINGRGLNSSIYAQEFNSYEEIKIVPTNPYHLIPVNSKTNYDTKVSNIENYLSKRNSPLSMYAHEFIDASDKYNIDYRLVASISIIESSGGKHCFKPYNAWGWGKSGFKSWEDGIWQVSKGLAGYYSDGLDQPSEIAYRYCPPSAKAWGNKVSYVMNMISSQ